jgi:hypothetical protein
VALEWDGRGPRLIDGCRLDGGYTEVAGERGSGRLWASNRVMFRADEIPPGCSTATHVVATFVVPPTAEKAERTPVEPSAILVPVPCPPTSDPKPARGCIGRGLTGAQRMDRAQSLIARFRQSGAPQPEVALALEIFALIPDDYLGVVFARRANTEDCALHDQAMWVGAQYVNVRDHKGEQRMKLSPEGNRPPVPTLDEGGSTQSCLMRPVFLQCFPGLFDPAPAGGGCWWKAETLRGVQ